MLLTNVCNFVNISRMSREQRYTPLASIPFAYDGQNGQMTWNFSLPPTVDTERLVMDSRQLRRIMTVAAFRAVHITEHQGEQTIFTPEISGIDASGQATASLKGTLNRAKRQRPSHRDDYSPRIMRMHGKTRAIASLNKPELAARVVDAKHHKQELTSEAAWSKELNNAINESLRATAREHLVNRDNTAGRLLTSACYGYISAATAVSHINPETTTGGPLVVYIPAAVAVTEALVSSYTGRNMLPERRWSLTPAGAEQWDRATWLLSPSHDACL